MSSDTSAIERPLVGGAAPAARRRVRRTQEQRRLVTRARLIGAVVEVIRRKGYAGLRAKHITAASGMTWGAAQHLFGDKNELLLQVATRVSDELVQRFDAGLAEPTAPLRDRVSAVVQLIWALYSSPDYYAMVEIVRGARADTRFHNKLVETLARFSARVEQHWLSIFSDVDIPESRSLSLCNIVVLTLSGLAARKLYLRLTPNTERMLDELVDCVATALGAGTAPRKRGNRTK
jgi:AcrR family transcriptional regulator